MKEKLLRDLYKKRGYDKASTDEAVGFVEEMEASLNMNHTSIEDPSLKAVKDYLAIVVSSGKNSPSRLLALARYYFVINIPSII